MLTHTQVQGLLSLVREAFKTQSFDLILDTSSWTYEYDNKGFNHTLRVSCIPKLSYKDFPDVLTFENRLVDNYRRLDEAIEQKLSHHKLAPLRLTIIPTSF